jgi:hypothetical protein
MTPAVVAVIEAGLEVIRQVLADIESAKAGQKVDPTVVLGNVQLVNDAVAQHNASIDAAEAAKFSAQQTAPGGTAP